VSAGDWAVGRDTVEIHVAAARMSRAAPVANLGDRGLHGWGQQVGPDEKKEIGFLLFISQ
jgi:hypothetical protein